MKYIPNSVGILNLNVIISDLNEDRHCLIVSYKVSTSPNGILS